ncbi:MAG: carboxypeptidase regulatory-like domain-containing protein [Muribaculaceae bacterium]|nr:carboxypeptidase regulatory-like domain-containing protein [Muribaculaceae bacterium]
MKLRLFLLLIVAALWPALGASAATVLGVVVDGSNGSPVSGATIIARDSNAQAVSNFNGQFRLTLDDAENAYIIVTADGYQSFAEDLLHVYNTINLGEIRLVPAQTEEDMFHSDVYDLVFDEAVLDEDEGGMQNVGALTGANDNLYYNTASYNFGPMYFRYRGLDSQYQSVYINGLKMNDLIRGSFSFSTLMGMTSRAFRNKSTAIGMEAANYGFGDIGGSVNYNTTTDLYAPGFNGALAYTNSNYMLRAMATYSTGLNKQGWAFTISAIGRYANEGVMEGTFYNSAGLFLSVEKKINDQNSLTLTAFGGPTQRATGRPTVQEAYDLAGTNLYNPDWGYQDGKKRSARITETFDPTAILNWLYKKDNTIVNTSAGFRSVYYNRTALNYYNATDPNPSYYKYLPSYFIGRDDMESAELYTDLWLNDPAFRQIKWDDMYQINYLNNVQNQNLPESEHIGSSYIMENRINHQLVGMFSSYVNTRLTDALSLQGGVSFNYTKSSNYKTVRDLMGGEFWLDIDPFSNREIGIMPGNLQNDLDNPNRHVVEGDRFGYDYDIHALRAEAWLQNVITLPKWDINYGLQMSYTQYQRDGKMRNGRAPNNSLGKSEMLRFDNVGVKAGATYKLDGRNQFAAHIEYGTRAPLFDQVFIAPRIKNTVVDNVENERDFSADLSYMWSYRRFRGSLTAFYADANNAIERNGFYDDEYGTYANYILTGVRRVNKGLELGMAYKITPSVTATFAGQFSRFQYKSNPQGTRSFENNMYPDTTQTVYLKNYYIGSTPQYCANVGIDWAAPKSWFFNVNATWQGDAYVNLAPRYHEAFPTLWESYGSSYEELLAKVEELSQQDKIKNAFTLNASIGKLIYINRNVSLNVNLNLNNILNNRDIVTYAYQQGRLRTTGTTPWDRNQFPTRFSYAQGFRMYLNIGVRF